MLRRTLLLAEETFRLNPRKQQKPPKTGNRIGDLTPTRHFRKQKRNVAQSASGEETKGTGITAKDESRSLRDALTTMETPIVWIWYPWRAAPETPEAILKLGPDKLKNLHGAVVMDLTPREKARMKERMWGITLPESRQKTFEAQHPFLASVLQALDKTPKGFPFWYKKYPTRHSAYAYRFNVPGEMLDGYPEEVKTALSFTQMTSNEQVKSQVNMYAERYAEHALDFGSPAVNSVRAAVQVREFRNHLLTNPNNVLWKRRLRELEMRLYHHLRALRKIDFRRYWEIIRDHDVQDIIQPRDVPHYRSGQYWMYEWDRGLALKTNIPDFMDPRGMNGCIETGRSRSEVARDLGLSYTRPLNDAEKRRLSNEARYYERLLKFKSEQPEQAREEQRQQYIKRFSGMFVKVNQYSNSIDYPSEWRKFLRVKTLRWQSKRHGPMGMSGPGAFV